MKSSELTEVQLDTLCKLAKKYMFDKLSGIMEDEEISHEELVIMMDEYEQCLDEGILSPFPNPDSGCESTSNEDLKWFNAHIGFRMLTVADWKWNFSGNLIGRAEAFGNIVLQPIIVNNDFSMLK